MESIAPKRVAIGALSCGSSAARDGGTRSSSISRGTQDLDRKDNYFSCNRYNGKIRLMHGQVRYMDQCTPAAREVSR